MIQKSDRRKDQPIIFPLHYQQRYHLNIYLGNNEEDIVVMSS